MGSGEGIKRRMEGGGEMELLRGSGPTPAGNSWGSLQAEERPESSSLSCVKVRGGYFH